MRKKEKFSKQSTALYVVIKNENILYRSRRIRHRHCDSVELLKSRANGEANNNTTDIANTAQNAPQSATHDSYETPKLEEFGDDEEFPF